MLLLTRDAYVISRWSGGTTTQLALRPPEASYAARDFLWRASSAAVEDQTSFFTALPDYDRWLMTLEGPLRLRHGGGPALRLEPFQPYAFDGGLVTESEGRCRDFNLMLRKGWGRGGMRPVRFAGAGETVLPPMGAGGPFSRRTLLLYCVSGGGRASLAGEALVLAPGESLLAEEIGEAPLGLSAAGPADFAAAEIWY